MTTYSLPIPEEPGERSVVLDDETVAWQRYGDRWFRTAQLVPIFGGAGGGNGLSWGELLIRNRALAPMIAESAIDDYLSRYDPVGCDSPSVTGEAVTEESERWDWTTPEARELVDPPLPPPRPSLRPRPIQDRPQA